MEGWDYRRCRQSRGFGRHRLYDHLRAPIRVSPKNTWLDSTSRRLIRTELFNISIGHGYENWASFTCCVVDQRMSPLGSMSIYSPEVGFGVAFGYDISVFPIVTASGA